MQSPQSPAGTVAYLAAVGTALPGDPVDNARLAKTLGVNDEWIDVFIGTRTRHFARDLESGEVRWSLADICAQAGERALAASGVAPEEIEFVVMGTATPDHLMPATVNTVADLLGLDQLPTYQLQSGCAGAVQALDLGRTLITGGGYRAGLVIGGDVCSKHLDLDRDLSGAAPSDLVNYVLFGDGAGAAVLTSEPRGHAVAVRRVLNRFTGLGREPGQVIDWFGLADRHEDRQAIREDYKAIEESVPVIAEEILWELLEELEWSAEDVDFLLPPQLSGHMTRRITQQLNLPGSVEVSCVADTGNNGNALPFLQLDALLSKMTQGQRALAVAVESSKWIKSGFALEKS
ncbi:3-oxoacyl-ACP synthase III family protein [Streptomyces clavuligerus]|uniref:3-oxoacyl-acyl-carrier-protein synthase III n=1 Tax=Streptomyces clavuligerus TaxID=1901 RepID=E2Q9B0_STRCL|nr:3-oxoacyl-ACP synthase III family protein [Streptomyces clavuligerus]ANW21341.1 3-oxoacyl-ACP synthase [Streptomyces clavuligerus]AXU15967.1 3-oxoacyl-ACP synthase [Streptomyces clavuligerus]EFG05530.1 3-oxoacyl- acyl-carrier-protein synthase III [Streptomyces clavuligerus]MBY6306101.1 3-oxoacyl-ACP synthase III family protein [Streptomyces clavuligerus]QCS08747.1 3-oxoacyl-ACP synthase [Streptomyces clavuligerus]